jgi:mannose-6-phosphate isomerase-like protein (cupin superfamily)
MAKQMTLETVAKQVEAAGRGYRISPAHVSRIENGEAAPNVIDLYWLNEVLDRPFGAFLAGAEAPWFIVRGPVADQRLDEVVAGTRTIVRLGPEHRLLTEKGVYKYVPLAQSSEDVTPADQFGTMQHPRIRAYLFRVGQADTSLMQEPEALSAHRGEELIYVLSGEIEFWSKHDSHPDVARRQLTPGDCLHFDSQAPHGFRAIGTTPARALFVYADPVVDPETREKLEVTQSTAQSAQASGAHKRKAGGR